MNNITVYITPGNEIRPGDEVTTTTSEFNFDCITGSFDKEATIPVDVIVEHIAEDYSEYVQGKSTNGGCYGYDYWKVIEVIKEDSLYGLPCNHRPIKSHFDWRNKYYALNRHKSIFSDKKFRVPKHGINSYFFEEDIIGEVFEEDIIEEVVE